MFERLFKAAPYCCRALMRKESLPVPLILHVCESHSAERHAKGQNLTVLYGKAWEDHAYDLGALFLAESYRCYNL